MEKTKVIRTHGRTTGVGIAHAGKPQVVLEFILHPDISQPMEEPPIPWYGFLLKFHVSYMIADLGCQLVALPLEVRGIQVLDLNRTGHLFIHAWGGEHDMGADLADIFLCCLGFFRKINGESYLNTARNRHHLLADPRKRKVGDKIIRVIAWIDCHQVSAHGQHVMVRKECPLWQCCRARGIEKQGHLVSMAFVDDLFKKPWFLFVKLPAQALNIFETYEVVFIVASHTFGIIPYDFFQPRAFIEDGNRFVYLFLAFTKQKSSV